MNFYDIYIQSVKSLDNYLDGYPERWTVQDKNSKYYGSFASFDMLADTADLGFVTTAVNAYCCSDSKYYKNPKMLEFIIHYSNATIAKLNPDDTNNMLASNFHTAEQFGLEKLASVMDPFAVTVAVSLCLRPVTEAPSVFVSAVPS